MPGTHSAVDTKLETVLMRGRIAPTQPGRKPPRNARMGLLGSTRGIRRHRVIASAEYERTWNTAPVRPCRALCGLGLPSVRDVVWAGQVQT
jgi:hypothetical protein